jgi:BirA family biotin operon repressor/biotin-[acetyl-CoA-carboxylase] ligase
MPIKVKWPNDIYLNEKKIAGILIQNSLSGKKISATVIGIGININQDKLSDDLPNATSLKIETNSDFDLNNLIRDLCFYLETRYLQLKTGHFKQINQDYLACLYKHEEVAFFERPGGQIFKGIIRGTSDYGKLIIEHASGLEEFDLKEITFKPTT